ncbi:helix-turn-helix domain-containing protein [Streptomyces syringium]|uniref:helix-turn-helix domain-containing protein n=1 Tax=Streptomyces syringium TaxID=76729 RepID=UPI003AAE22FF
MPGSRLTQQDRRHIAAGLAERLSYTEIAKRLDRPASTITREVMRNGGPLEYRADRAHHATKQRARRGRSAGACPPSATRSVTTVYGRDAEAVRDYGERLAQLLVATGFPRMAAGVLVCLYTTDSGSVTTADLVQRLQVSPASISKAVGYLEGLELIRRERDARKRRERYVIDDGIWLTSLLASARLNTLLAETARDGADLLGARTPAGARLSDMSHCLEHVVHVVLEAIEHWQPLRPVVTHDESLPGTSGPSGHYPCRCSSTR